MTLQKIAVCISLLFVSIMFQSCNPVFYCPTPRNVPLFSEKGEFTTNLSQSSEFDLGLDAQYAYALTDNVGLMANLSFYNSSGSIRGKGYLYELGSGYFMPIKDLDYLIFEAYGLIGFGDMELKFLTEEHANGLFNSNILRLGIQPSFGFKHKYFSAAITARLVYLNHFKIRGENPVFYDLNLIDHVQANNNNFLFEPALTLRAGLENIKLQVQLGAALFMKKSDLYIYESSGSIGVHFYFNRK